MDFTNEANSFVTIASKWLAAGTGDVDDTHAYIHKYTLYTAQLPLNC